MPFKGTLGDLSVPDLLQMPSLGRLTGALVFSNGDRESSVYYVNGSVVHAEMEDMVGEEVIYDLLGWTSGRFSFEKGVTSPRTTITKDVQHLLLEGLRRLDERAKAEAEQKERWRELFGDEAALASALGACMAGAGVSLRSAALLDRDARVLATWPSGTKPSGADQALFKTSVRMWKGAEASLEQVYWGREGAWVAGRSIGRYLLLVGIAKESAGLGQLHFAFKKAADLIYQRLGATGDSSSA